MKILYITTIGITMNFFRSYIGELVSEGHTVDIATNDSESKVDPYYTDLGCKVYTLSCSRSPIDRGNIRAVGEIRRIVSDGAYDIVHCHTPIAAAVTRLACRKLRKDYDHPVRVIYTSHGFHFYTGAPFINWALYYPIEVLCAHFTDDLITINREDHKRALRKLKAGRIHYVPGVGIDTIRFSSANGAEEKKTELLESLGLGKDAFILLSVGELNDNKNHSTVIRAMSDPRIKDRDICYLIAGSGDKEEELRRLTGEQGSDCRVRLLGYRKDIPDLLNAADVYLLPSIREGLNVSLMEAMACSCPCICSRIRGNVDLIDDGKGGFTVSPLNCGEWADAIIKMSSLTGGERLTLGRYNSEKIKAFTYDAVNAQMKDIYGS